MQRIVTDYHMRIDQQTASVRNVRRVSAQVKHAVAEEWARTNFNNTLKFKEWRDEMAEAIARKQRNIERSNLRL
jgi:hypothetical protein